MQMKQSIPFGGGTRSSTVVGDGGELPSMNLPKSPLIMQILASKGPALSLCVQSEAVNGLMVTERWSYKGLSWAASADQSVSR